MENDKLGMKLSTFSGKTENWQPWKRKFIAYTDALDLLDDLNRARPADAAEDATNEVKAQVKEAQAR